MLPSLQQQAIDIVDAGRRQGRVRSRGRHRHPLPVAGIPHVVRAAAEGSRPPGRVERPRSSRWRKRRRLEGADLTPALELVAYLTEAINERRAEPGTATSCRRCSPARMPSTTPRSIGPELPLRPGRAGHRHRGDGIRRCWSSPATRSCGPHCARDPDQINVFVEEIVRLEPPAPMLPRVTTDRGHHRRTSRCPPTPWCGCASLRSIVTTATRSRPTTW